MARIDAVVPPLPRELEALRQYLMNRDVSPPSEVPVPINITVTVLVAGFEIDELTWTYEQPDPRRGRIADGFFVSVFQGTSTDFFEVMALRLSIDSRRFQWWWPDGVERHYAIAAFRNTHQGEQQGPLQTIDAWQNVT